ncbi:hypothetical protein ACRRTK_013457 [Alexandromys fortis]
MGVAGVEGEGGLGASFQLSAWRGIFRQCVCNGGIKQEIDSWLLCEAPHQLQGRHISPVLQSCPFSCWLSIVGAVNHPVWLLWRWETLQGTGPGQASRVLSSVTQCGASFAASDCRAWPDGLTSQGECGVRAKLASVP